MSSRKVVKFKRTIKVESTSWAAGVLTINTVGNHNLVAGNIISVVFTNVPQHINDIAVATAPSATSITIPTSMDYGIGKDGRVYASYFVPANTGVQDALTITHSTYGDAVLQSFVSGTGTAVYNVNVSLDGVHWHSLGTVTHAAADNDSKFTLISPAWVYVAPDITSIGASTKLTLMLSS